MILIFGKGLCSKCQEAKKAFEADGIDHKYIDLNNMTPDQRVLAIFYGALVEEVPLPVIVRADEIGEVIDEQTVRDM